MTHGTSIWIASEYIAPATLGGTGTIDLSYTGLAAGTRYLGSVVYGGAAGMPNPTIVRVDTP